MSDNFLYTGDNTKEISFPIGGIGTGCIGLSGSGRLIDWEIFNRPHKGSYNGFSHFGIKAEKEEEVIDARVLNGDLHPPYTGELNKSHFNSYGFGPPRATMAGVPHFKEVEFRGEYPLAELNFKDESFPGQIEMEAYNPFIPLNDKDSSIPGAFFEIEVKNTTQNDISYTIELSLNNPFPWGTTINEYRQKEEIDLINFRSNKYEEDHPDYGELSIATNASEVSYQEYWYRGQWFDNLGIFWDDFNTKGKLENRNYSHPAQGESQDLNPGTDVGTLAAHIDLKPGASKKVRFIITWNFPNRYNYWNPEKDCESEEEEDCKTEVDSIETWKNYYATVFDNSIESALYALKNWDRLYRETKKFKKALFNSSLPEVAIEAISANLSTLKSPTCFRLEDGSFYGFEGCHCDSGCCEGSCTHVWNYAYALPFLFPKLERSMRDLDFKYNQKEDGAMAFRLQLPLGREPWNFRPCADGQFGGVIKSYREWKISGDDDWLKSNWEAIKKSIEYAWSETNEDKWDLDKDGVLEGRQHHTLDMELFGPNSWLTGFYLAALKAGAEMAEYLGEKETAAEYRELFKKGKTWVDENLFNGEFYHQIIDLEDKSILDKFKGGEALKGGDTVAAYWNEEAEEIKYQVAEGCEIDQVIAQWHANNCGLGEIFDPEQNRKALKSLYKYNFKESMRDHFNPCRLYSLNDEGGLVICEYPEHKYRPVVPLPYAEETQNGYEYQAAIHMIQAGLIEEGMEVVESIRDRYDGEKRNPWNEFECGNNYARSMATYSLLTTYSGFEYDMVENRIGFDPINIEDESEYQYFWSLDSGWGIFKITSEEIKIKVLHGKLKLKQLKLPFLTKENIEEINYKEENLDFAWRKESIVFDKLVEIKQKDLIIKLNR